MQSEFNEAPVFLFLIFILSVAITIFIYKDRQYKKGAYYQVTKIPYSLAKTDKGKYGEYLTYKSLRHFENGGGRFLFNILIPKTTGGSTEIDTLLICSKGLFVIECKNYSGWIFGNEAHKNWTQTLPKGWSGNCHKERFYNPIMQNAQHLRHLRHFLGNNIPLHSVIAFSDRCELKNITINSNNVSVVNNKDMPSVIQKLCNQAEASIFTETDIINIYNKLYPYTQLNSSIIETHIESVRNIKNPSSTG